MGVKVEVYRADMSLWGGKYADEVLQELADARDAVPDRHADTAQFEILEHWSGAPPTLVLCYERPFTAAEMAEEEARAADHRAQAEAADRAHYERLRARFGDEG